MSYSSHTQPPSLSLRGFGGMDTTAVHTDASCAAEVVNFRIRADGSLSKREGYRLLVDCLSPIRAFWSGKICGAAYTYVLVENRVCTVSLSSGALTDVGTVESFEGAAHFFFYQGTLFLLDGSHLYECQDGVPRICQGYVPLIGKDWSNRAVGQPYEPRNLLTRRARISYIISDPPTLFLAVPSAVESVDAVYVNGSLLPEDRYAWDEAFQTVNVQGLAAGDRVLVYLTFVEENRELLQAFCSCTHSILFGTPSRNRLFFWGGRMPSMLFCTSAVSAEQQAGVHRIYPNSNGLYLPEGSEFCVGEGRCAVQSAVCASERLLIFTEEDTWMAQEGVAGTEASPTAQIHATLGCSALGGATLAAGAPVSVGNGSVWQWSVRSDGTTAVRLSSAIDAKLSPEEYRHATVFYSERDRELWLHSKDRGDVLVFSLVRNSWVRFDGIVADRFFETADTVGFVRDGKIFLFDPTLTHDRESDSDQRPICAQYQSGMTDFGNSDKKMLARAVLYADIHGGALRLSFAGCGTKEVSRSVAPSAHFHQIVCRRIATGSFRYGFFRIEADGDTQAVVHALTLLCR